MEPSLSWAGEAADGQEAIELCRSLNPDMVVLDIDMPRTNGLDASRRIKAERPVTRVIVLSTLESQAYRDAAARAGADAFISKGTSISEILKAMRSACEQGEER